MESDTSSFNKSNLFLMEFMYRFAIIRLFLHESRMFFNIDLAADLASAAPLILLLQSLPHYRTIFQGSCLADY